MQAYFKLWSLLHFLSAYIFLSKWGWKPTVSKVYLVDGIHEPLLIFSRQVVASGYGRKRSTLPWCQVLWESSTLGQCHSCGSTSSAFLRGSRWKQIKKRNKSEWLIAVRNCMVKFGIPYDGMVLHTMRNKYNKDRINTYIIVRELAYAYHSSTTVCTRKTCLSLFSQ